MAGYSNDVFTYLPSARVLAEGGYEAGGTALYGLARSPPSCEERVVAQALALARAPDRIGPDRGRPEDRPAGHGAACRRQAGHGEAAQARGATRQPAPRHPPGDGRPSKSTGRQVTLDSATYHLPVTVGDVQIDCPITKGYLEHGDHWGLDADARLRLWPAGYPWITPGTLAYPANQRWFASDTLMANQIGDGDDIKSKSIYYHWGLDFGGAERMVDVLAATDGQVVSAAGELLQPGKYPPLVKPRADVVYLRDGRGWFYRYSHLDSIDPAAKLGAQVKMGQKIGVLGKKGASGGWSHLHFDIVAPQPSGRWGILEGYALLFEAYHNAHPLTRCIEAVARPHQLAAVGQPVTLDGCRSWSRRGPGHITSYSWTFSDGKTARGPRSSDAMPSREPTARSCGSRTKTGTSPTTSPLVYVLDPNQPDQQPPRVHAAYWPTARHPGRRRDHLQSPRRSTSPRTKARKSGTSATARPRSARGPTGTPRPRPPTAMRSPHTATTTPATTWSKFPAPTAAAKPAPPGWR